MLKSVDLNFRLGKQFEEWRASKSNPLSLLKATRRTHVMYGPSQVAIINEYDAGEMAAAGTVIEVICKAHLQGRKQLYCTVITACNCIIIKWKGAQ